MFGRNYFGGQNFGGAKPTARLAGRPRLGQQSGLACCTAPNGMGYCFDSGSGECVATWVSASGGPPGSPACVLSPKGDYVHPSCLGLEPGPATSRPELPPGCTYVAAEGNAMQEVICECYNCTTKKSDGWRGMLGAFVAAGGKNPCLKDPQWFPKPAQCPAGGGGSYTPPTALPAPAPSAPPVESGDANAADGSFPVAIIACPIGGNLYNLYEDSGAPPYPLVSEGRNNVQANAEGHILPSNDPRCVAALAGTAAPPPGTPAPPPSVTPPFSPVPTGAYPPPPGQVTIQPTPFGGGSVAPRQVPFSPAARGMPMQRPTFSSCPASTPPVKVRQLRSETYQARPDNFQAPLWTNF